MSDQNDNTIASNGMGPALVVAVGAGLMVITYAGAIPLPDGNMAAKSAQSLGAQFALLFLVTVIGAVLAHQLQHIINVLEASDN